MGAASAIYSIRREQLEYSLTRSFQEGRLNSMLGKYVEENVDGEVFGCAIETS